MLKVGIGYDVHRLIPNRLLILGGVKIPFDKGLDGHSDADVVVHAISDALLGAVALGDIGYYFPDTDQKNKDLDSFIILKKVLQIVSDEGYIPNNFDVVIHAEKPKISPYVQDIRKKLAEVLTRQGPVARRIFGSISGAPGSILGANGCPRGSIWPPF